jgi:hypothetical protein
MRPASSRASKYNPGARWDENHRVLDISADLEALDNLSGEYWISAVLTEDNVRGTGAGWSQANAYAGGGKVHMGGYEALPNPFPAFHIEQRQTVVIRVEPYK